IHWARTTTNYADGKLVISHMPSEDPTWYSYFPPYKPDEHQALLNFCSADERAIVLDLCHVSEKDKLELITIGNDEPDALKIWVIARQHPGEIQASWWMEGFVRRLFDHTDPTSLAILKHAKVL